MKKLFSLLAVAGFLLTGTAQAIDLTSGQPPFVSRWGSTMKNGSAILASGFPGGVACIDGFVGTAATDITVGDPVVLAGTTFAYNISRTATAVDTAVIGVALNTAAYGTEVQVCSGGLARANIAQSITVGDELVTSATAGKLTKTAVIAEASYTALSRSAVVAKAMETKTYVTYSASVIVKIIGH